jgi:hypothetical protein
MIVVTAAMYLTVEFNVGVGRESLARKFLLMVSDKDEDDKTEIGMGKSLGPLSLLVKRFIALRDTSPTEVVSHREEVIHEAHQVVEVEQEIISGGQEAMSIDS